MFWTLTIADYYTPTIAQEIHLSSCFRQYQPNSCILFIKNRKKEYTHNRVLLYAVRGFFTRGRLSLLTLYCKTHSGQHMDEHNLHYYIARWDKSDLGGQELYQGYNWGLKMDYLILGSKSKSTDTRTWNHEYEYS